MNIDELLPLLKEAASIIAWVLGVCGSVIGILIAVIWRSRAKQTDMLIEITQRMDKSVSNLNLTMLEVRNATGKQWKKLSEHDVDIAILKSNQQNGSV